MPVCCASQVINLRDFHEIKEAAMLKCGEQTDLATIKLLPVWMNKAMLVGYCYLKVKLGLEVT